MSTRARILVALAAAAWGGLLAFGFMIRRGFYPDFLAFWYAARAFLHGLDPYAVTPSGAPYFINDRFFYPFPAVLVLIPFAPFAFKHLAFRLQPFKTHPHNYILNPANKHLNLGVYTFTQQTNTYEAGPIQQAQIY